MVVGGVFASANLELCHTKNLQQGDPSVSLVMGSVFPVSDDKSGSGFLLGWLHQNVTWLLVLLITIYPPSLILLRCIVSRCPMTIRSDVLLLVYFTCYCSSVGWLCLLILEWVTIHPADTISPLCQVYSTLRITYSTLRIFVCSREQHLRNCPSDDRDLTPLLTLWPCVCYRKRQ